MATYEFPNKTAQDELDSIVEQGIQDTSEAPFPPEKTGSQKAGEVALMSADDPDYVNALGVNPS